MPSWIKFVEVNLHDGRRTKVWAVLTRDGKATLGTISWYAQWRRYALVVKVEAGRSIIFDATWLTEVANFITEQTEERKMARRGEWARM